jgi:predicted PurR-regulated permease PerM
VKDHSPNIVSTPLTARVTRWGLVAWSTIGVLILAAIAWRFVLYPIRFVFAPLLLAVGIVYLLNPLVTMMQRRGIRRAFGAIITYLVFFTIIGLAVRALAPSVANQVTGFARAVPSLLDHIKTWVAHINTRFHTHIDINGALQNFTPGGKGGQFFSKIFSAAGSVLHGVVVFVLGAVLAIYLLIDLPKIQAGAMALIPARRQPEVRTVLDSMSRAVGGFFRGQLLLALFVGIACMIGFYVVGLPYWAVAGVVVGVTKLIPLIGPFIGAIPVSLIALTAGTKTGGLLHLHPGLPLFLGAGLVIFIVVQVDIYVLSPNVVAKTVKMHPVTVMLGLVIGGELLGILGMILTVPIVASVKILGLYFWDTHAQWPPKPSDEPPPDHREMRIEPIEDQPPGAERVEPIEGEPDPVAGEQLEAPSPNGHPSDAVSNGHPAEPEPAATRGPTA